MVPGQARAPLDANIRLVELQRMVRSLDPELAQVRLVFDSDSKMGPWLRGFYRDGDGTAVTTVGMGR